MRPAAVLFLIAAPSTALGQSFLFRYHDSSTPGVGFAVRGIGDVNADGVADLAIGSFRLDCGFAGCGPGPSKFAMVSGATQTDLWSIAAAVFDGGGYSLDRIDDLDGDGRPDLLVGAPYAGGFPWTTGEARIHSGATGALLRTFLPVTSPNSNFGLGVAGLGDVDGDSIPDVAISGYDQAHIYSGATGAHLRSLAPAVSFPVTTVVARYGDFDGDGSADVLVGQVSGDGVTSGNVNLFSGATGAVLKSFSPGAPDTTFGSAVAAAGDFDGDARPDVIIGSTEIDFGSGVSGMGRVHLVASSNGAVLNTFLGTQMGEHLGSGVAGGRDYDADGVTDIAAAAACENAAPGCVRHAVVWSGASGQVLLDASSIYTGEYGVSVDFLGDLDGNSVGEFAFGSPCTQPFSDCGEVRVYGDAAGSQYAYCTAGTTSHGCVPSIGATGVASASASSGFTLHASNVEGQKQGIFFYGISGQVAFPWGIGSTSFLCVKTPTQRMSTQGSGGTNLQCDGSFTEDWNAYMAAHPTALGSPRFAGETFDAQAWFRDPPAPKTTNLTDALHFQLLP
jgi:hypothetical protein